MKKLSISIFAIAFILMLTGCSPKSTTSSNAPSSIPSSAANSAAGSIITSNAGSQAAYKDGTYDVKQKSTKPGYEEAVVIIKGGKIDNIELKRLDQNQKEINYNDWDGTKNGYPNLKKYRVDLAQAMLAKQSPDVDAISGATASSDGWKAAVTSALAKAK